MAFKLISSTKLELLVKELAENLYTGLESVLDSPLVVVQSKGMQRWVSLEIARHSGIAAGIEFLFLNGLFDEVIFSPCQKEHGLERELVSREQLKWLVYKILEENADKRVFSVLNGYIEADKYKQLQIADKIASLYDMYSLYRADWLLAWEQGETVEQDVDRKNEQWLAELWRLLKRAGRFNSFAELSEIAINWLNNDYTTGKEFPPAIHIFGVSSLPPRYLFLLDRLAGKTDVYFYYLEVCTEYWGLVRAEKDILRREGSNYEVGNALLGALGQRNRDFFNELIEYTGTKGVQEKTLPVKSDNTEDKTLLRWIQHDIRGMFEHAEKVVVAEADRSVVFHSCYGKMRQVEVLYQSLLNEFVEDGSLKPKDILVLTADIKEYVPYIKAVFGTVDYKSSEYIPFTISDRAVIDESSYGKLLLAFLNLFTGRFKVSEVLGGVYSAFSFRKMGYY